MPYTVKHNPSLGIIELTFSGLTTSGDLRESTSQCISLGKETGTTNFLVDASGMELAASISDLYNLPAQQYEDEKADRDSRVGVILPRSREAREAVEFYKLACKNRGWFVEVFSECETAVDWLVGKASSD
jgi:hypothetical protein